ncbi:hypothetical protein MRB53_008693 [Persea americana]|uniref:Uncharacterized protein n=1 Tax=Persea americana TaxID=3435 RepID=A0ACC2MMK7_PERAE|nr:hypothetical protein MRB53_008693 [Persea americana]
MGRSPCCSKEGVNRGAWSAEEDEILSNYIKTNGEGKWRDLPRRAGLRRCGKSCRLRWLNYLRPDIKRGNISSEEEDLIIRLHKLLGNRWSLIAGRLPGRTDNEIKNYWNTCLGKRMKGQSSSKTGRKGVIYGSEEKKHSTETLHEPHKVIQTNATRCNKVLLPPQQGEPIKEKDTDVGLLEIPSVLASQDGQYLGFLMDFDFGGLLVSDVLDSSYMLPLGDEIHEKSHANGGDCDGNSFSSSFDHHLALNEAVLGDWSESNLVQNGVAPEIERLGLP